METFTSPRVFVKNTHYQKQRQESLIKLDLNCIDPPIIALIRGFSKLKQCFTLQSCYGHFIYPGNLDSDNIKPLPVESSIESIEYRIAYLAICIADSTLGKELFANLAEITLIDPEYIQFGSADWFWERQLNSYSLQVEPKRFLTQDRCRIDYEEALHVEKIRNQFFKQLSEMLQNRLLN